VFYIFKTLHEYNAKICRNLLILTAFICVSQFNSFAQSTVDSLSSNDSIKKEKPFLTSEITYKASDSIIYGIEDKRIYMYGDAQVDYGDMNLKAAYIVFNMETNVVFAVGKKDSMGGMTGRPIFKEGKEEFEADSLTYNFQNKKGVIRGVFSEQSGGYLHSDITKKQTDGSIDMKGGKYTTCELDHPHYYVALTKAKAIPQEKIVSGPLYFVIADIPIPIFLPFGYFPSQGANRSGVLIPTYGEEVNRGFFLANGGYYWHINDHINLAVVGDIYSIGSWGLNARSTYMKRYKYNGNFDLKYSKIIIGEEGTEDFNKSNSYWVHWQHNQDAKANPSRTFSANVDFGASNYQKYNARQANDYLSNTFGSSVSYNKRWDGTPFNLSANLRHSQNTQTKTVSMSLPAVTFTMSRIFPLKKKESAGRPKWFEKISLSYTSSLEKNIQAGDSVVFKKNAPWRSGYQHTVPINASYKITKNITMTPAINYTGVVNPNYLDRQWYDKYTYQIQREGKWIDTTLYNQMITDTINRFRYAHNINPNISFAWSPIIYGFYGFAKPDKHSLKAVRHMMIPNISFNYRPALKFLDDWSFKDYSQNVQTDSLGRTEKFSYFSNGLYQIPTGNEEYGSINFSLSNQLEAKLKTAKDTADEPRKIKLLESLNAGTSYNLFKDSLNLSDINLSARTTLFEQINIDMNANFTPYAWDKDGRTINKYQFETNKRLGAMTSISLSSSISLNPDMFLMSKEQNKKRQMHRYYSPYGYQYMDFSMPWNLSLQYSIQNSRSAYNVESHAFDFTTTQTLNFSGDLKMTEKWRFGFTSGWDFTAKQLTYTSCNLYRDLHCWEMRFNWIPFGQRQSYNFQINIKASAFQDLKWKKQKSFYDNQSW